MGLGFATLGLRSPIGAGRPTLSPEDSLSKRVAAAPTAYRSASNSASVANDFCAPRFVTESAA